MKKKFINEIQVIYLLPIFAKKIIGMPTLLRLFGLRFFFWSREHKPMHVHVESSDGIAKFEIETDIRLIENLGLTEKDIKLATAVLKENQREFITKWINYHG